MTVPHRFEGAIVAAPLEAMSALEVHDVYKLRVDVFVVEQAETWPEIDDADADPSTVHLRAYADDADGAPLLVGVARVLPGETADGRDAVRIGRVCVAADHRSAGVGAALVEEALSLADGPFVLDAQEHLESWYGGFGFVRDGDVHLEGTVPHVPMRRG
ncbi:GNAT family N-acetyltransferase [Corynebacterium sp. 335C]